MFLIIGQVVRNNYDQSFVTYTDRNNLCLVCLFVFVAVTTKVYCGEGKRRLDGTRFARLNICSNTLPVKFGEQHCMMISDT